MDNIIEPNETFDFSKLSLAHPSGIQGGAYFTKIEYNKNNHGQNNQYNYSFFSFILSPL